LRFETCLVDRQAERISKLLPCILQPSLHSHGYSESSDSAASCSA
jgi:hypothetical protein